MAIRPPGAIEAVIAAHGRVEQRQAGEAQKLLTDARATAARPRWRKLPGRPAVLSVAVALLLAGSDARGQMMTGNDALHPCQAPAVSAYAYETGLCLGIIRGLMHNAEVHYPLQRFCPPDGVTYGQARRVVVDKMVRTPGILHRNFEDIAILALREAWPCRR
jgi:hypothetical protein